MAHYRSPVNFSDELLTQAKNALERLYTAKFQMQYLLERCEDKAPSEDEAQWADHLKTYNDQFIAAMDDDLNTADAIAAMFELVRDANSTLTEASSKQTVEAALQMFNQLSDVLGLATKNKDEKEGSLEDEIEALIEKRQAARKAKDFATADAIRDDLAAKGIILEDTRDGVKWHKA
jgi:cysteinyl-tRNA synthetase